LGVAGQTGSEHQRIVDPEALLLLTCTVGRHDVRLFDEMLDWLQANGWLINVMRLKRILRTEQFRGQLVLGAVAGLLAKGAETPKWKQLADLSEDAPEMEKLFFGEDGRPIPVIGEPEPAFARRALGAWSVAVARVFAGISSNPARDSGPSVARPAWHQCPVRDRVTSLDS